MFVLKHEVIREDLKRAFSLLIIALAALSGCGSTSSPARADLETALDAYIARPEPDYKWEKTGTPMTVTVGEGALRGNVRISELRLTSQNWQKGLWTHRVHVFR